MYFRLLYKVFLAVCITSICNIQLIHAQDKKEADQRQIEDLLYRNTLFHYYSADYISALTKILINEKRLLANIEADRTKILQGGIYLAYGLDYDAKQIFEHMNTDSLDEELRNVIWFYLGKDFYNNFDYVNAADSLEKITKDASYGNKQEKYNILSNAYVYTNNIAKLESILLKGEFSENDKTYIKFNLAIAYLKDNQLEKSKKILSEISGIKVKNVEHSTISDKAKLHLANLAFKEKKYKDTIKYINDMDANGLYSDGAIYLAALSHSITGNVKKAYSLLNTLKARESKNIFKYYSVLLISRILEQSGNFEQALKILNDGLDSITTEKKELDALLNKIRKDFFLADLKKTKDGDIVITNQEYKSLVDELIFNKDFSNHYNNYIDLVALKKTINHWQNQIPQLSIMLKERDRFFKEKKAHVSVAGFSTQKSQFQKIVTSMHEKYSRVEKTPDARLLYTDAELEHADDLDFIEQKVKRLSKHEDLSDIQDKIRIMKGINYWNAASQYQPRLWEARAELKETDEEYNTLIQRIESLKKAAKSEFHYTKYANEISEASKRMAYLSQLLESITARLKEQLIQIAAEELDRRFKGIDAYHQAFKYDVARVSDRIFINKKQ